MSGTEEYYRQLLADYLNNNCTPQQAEEILDFLRQDVSDKILLQQLQDEFNHIIKEEKEVPADVSDNVRNRLMQIIGPATVIPFYRRPFFRIAAAAVVTGLLAGGYFLFSGKRSQSVQSPVALEKNTQDDVKSGGNKAILTLSDGSSILLDSAQNGSLTRQGNTKVLKINNGLLAYNADKSRPGEIIYNTLTTPRGGQYRVTLSDGTQVWLNAASSITFPTVFSGKERKVEVTGEVYFEVTKNAAMPFIVKKVNDDVRVRVLGTHFNVNAYDDESEMRITLLEGAVDVAKGDNHSILKPGEQARIINEKINVTDHADLDEVMAWKNGRFYFEEADIKTIMRQVEKWYNVEVKYEADIKYSFVAEISRSENVSRLLNILELTRLVHFKIEGNKITVMK